MGGGEGTKDRTSLFTAELAETPGDYIAGLRLEVGRELLAATDLKVSRIGPALGYTGGADTFSKAFKRRHKLSPSASGSNPTSGLPPSPSQGGDPRGRPAARNRDLPVPWASPQDQ